MTRIGVVFVALCTLFSVANGVVSCCDIGYITTAITTASNGATLVLSAGTYTGQCGITMGGTGKNITLVGGPSTIQCSNTGARPFYAFDLTNDFGGDVISQINIVTQTRTNSTAIGLANGAVQLNKISITGFELGIYLSAGRLVANTLSIIDCHLVNPFIRPVAYNYGAGVHADTSYISITGGVFRANTAVSGGAFWVGATTLVVNNSTFVQNTADQVASCFLLQGGLTTITGSMFTGNSALNSDGGVFNVYGNALLTLNNVNMTSNQATYSGCFRVADGGTIITVRNSLITGCSATSIFATFALVGGSHVIAYNTTFSYASAYNGAFMYTDDPNCSFEAYDCTFTNPPKNGDDKLHAIYGRGTTNLTRCSINGGYIGLFMHMTNPGRAFVTDTNFTNLIGAVNYDGSALSTFQRCQFTNNGPTVGSVITLNTGNMSFVDSLFQSNSGVTGTILLLQDNTQFIRTRFINNMASAAGGAIYAVSGNHVIRDCTFIGNSIVDGTGTVGGAVAMIVQQLHLGFMTITRSTFIGNSARSGAAVLLIGQATCTVLIWDCQFYNHTTFVSGSSNSVGGPGGTISSYIGLNMQNTLIVNSSATQGGAISFTGVFNQNLYNVTLRNCFATQQGGGMYASYSSVGIIGVSISRLSAPSGGVLFGDALSSYGISNSSFTQNSASGNGGAVCAQNVILMNVYFAQNTASLGGAFSGFGQGYLSCTNCTFISNTASDSGGGIATSVQGQLSLISSLLSSNVATRYGGGVFVNYVSTGIIIVSTTISNNRANAGGGLYLSAVVNTGATYFVTSLIQGNSAGTLGGGGVYLNAYMQLLNTRVIGNSSPLGSGGGVYSSDTLIVYGGEIDSNTASSGGGIYCRLCTMSLQSSLYVTNNQATDGGGFWCNLGSSFAPEPTVYFHANMQTINPVMSVNCQCGCCATPATPASIAAPDCILSNGRSCTYQCDLGYDEANPAHQFVCNTSVPAKPFYQPRTLCDALPCPPITPNANCSVTQPIPTAYTTDIATFFADIGFTLVGNTTVTCRGPTWLGTYPICTPNPCRATLVAPLNGFVSNTTGRNGDVVEYTCDVGYTRTGASINKCLNTGDWSDSPPTCTAIGCVVLPAPGNGSIFIDSQPATGAIATFTCNRGYLPIGNTTIFCLGGNWSDPSPYCEPQPCGEMRAPINGVVGNANGTTNTYATFTCNDGFYIVGDTQRLCLAPTWLGSSPTCHPVVCNTTDHVDLQTACPPQVAYGTSCTFGCVAGTSGDTPTSICTSTAETPTGAFVPSLGLCSPCNAGSFSTGSATDCTLCPHLGSTLAIRTTAQSDCLCAPGFYEATPGAGDCVDCPAGGFCAGGKEQPVSAPGFYKNSQIFAPCSPGLACTGNNLCATGYIGFACGACQLGYYRLNGYCYPCPNDGPWRIILLVVAGLVAVRALIAVVAPEAVGDRTYGLVSVNIALSFLQIVATYSDLRIRWPPATRALYDAFSLVNLNIEIVNPECVAPLTFWDKMEIQLLMPIIVLAMFIAVWALMLLYHFVRNKYPPLQIMVFHAKKLAKISAAGYMFFMILAYLFLAKAALTLFACDYQGGNVYTLALSPSDLCYTGEWLKVAPLAVFGIIAYIVAVPIVVHAVYLRSRRQYGAAVATNSLFSNFLVAKFRSDAWFWEVAVMLRKLLMVIVATFGVSDSYGQVAASFAVMLLSVLFSLPVNPYKWRKHNLVEHASLFSGLAVLFCGLLLSADSIASNPTSVAAIDALIVTSVFVFIFAVLGCLALEIRVYYAILKLKAQLQPDKVTALPACNTRLVLVVPFRAQILTVSDEGSVRAWHADSLLPYRAFEMKEKVTMATVRGTELYIINDKGLVVWDIDRQASIDTRSVHAPVISLGSSDDFLFMGHENGDLSFWAFKKKDEKKASEYATVEITDQANEEGSVIPTTLTIFTAGCQLMGDASVAPAAHSAAVTALKPVGLVLYAADRKGTIRKWSLKSFKCFRQWTVTDLPTGVYITAIEEVGTQIAVGFSEGVLRFISVEAGSRSVRGLRLQTRPISCLSLCNGMLLSASEDGRIIVLSGATRRLLQMLPDAEAAVTALSVMADGTVVYGDDKGILRKYRIIPEWHMREPDPHILTKLINYAKKRITAWWAKRKLNMPPNGLLAETSAAMSAELSAAAQQDIYDELGVLAESLDLPAIPWRVLDGASAESVVLALAGETQKRRDHSEGLRRRPGAGSSYAPLSGV